MRRIAGGGVAVATVMLAVLPVGAAARPTVVPSAVEGSTGVPAGGSRTLTLHCPKTSVALHAAPVRLPSGVRVADSAPGDSARRWTLRFASVARERRRVSATVRCVRLNLPGGVSSVTLRVGNDSRSNVRLPAGSSVDIDIRCRSGYLPTGQGVGMSTRAVRLVSAVPNGHGWVFRVENNGSARASVSARIRCLQRVARGRRNGAPTSLRFKVKRIAYVAPVSSGRRRSLTGSCGRDRFSLGTGTSLERDGNVTLLTSFPFGRREGSWSFRNRGAAEPVTNYLLCLSRSSRFR